MSGEPGIGSGSKAAKEARGGRDQPSAGRKGCTPRKRDSRLRRMNNTREALISHQKGCGNTPKESEPRKGGNRTHSTREDGSGERKGKRPRQINVEGLRKDGNKRIEHPTGIGGMRGWREGNIKFKRQSMRITD